jgi:cytochrome c6
VLVGLMAGGAWVRTFYNFRHQGRTHWWMPVVAAAAFVAIAVAVDRSSDTSAAPTDAATVARGKQVFVTAGCGACHTLSDAGSTAVVGPDLDAAEPSAALVEQRVRNGQGVMPAFAGTLSDEQIDAVAAYVSSVAGG